LTNPGLALAWNESVLVPWVGRIPRLPTEKVQGFRFRSCCRMPVDNAFWIGFASIAATILSILAAGFLVYVGYIWQKHYEADRVVEDTKARIGSRLYGAFTSPRGAVMIGILEGYEKSRLDTAFDRFCAALEEMDTKMADPAKLPALLESTRAIARCLPIDSMEMAKVAITGVTLAEGEPLPIDQWISGTRHVASRCAWILETRSESVSRCLQRLVTGSDANAAFSANGIMDFLNIMQSTDSDLHALTKAQRDASNLRVTNRMPVVAICLALGVFAFFLGVVLPLHYAIDGVTDSNEATRTALSFFLVLGATLVMALWSNPEALTPLTATRVVVNRFRRWRWRRWSRDASVDALARRWWICTNPSCCALIDSGAMRSVEAMKGTKIVELERDCEVCHRSDFYSSWDSFVASREWNPRWVK